MDAQATAADFAWCDDPLSHWAKQRPDRIAITDPLYRLTYRELGAAVRAGAEALAGRAVGAGDRVLILCENSVAAVVAILAAQTLRAWPIPLNARLTAAEADKIMAHAAPRVVIATTGVSDEAKSHAARLGARDPFLTFGAVILNNQTPGHPEYVGGDPARDVAALLYTSGTTGEPKGVMLTHDNLVFVAERSTALRGVHDDDHVYCALPISHIFGLGSALGGALYRGNRIDLVPRFDPAKALQAFAEDGVTAFSGVPQMHTAMCALGEAQGGIQAPALEFLGTGGAPLDPMLKVRVETLFGIPLCNGYGLTETAPLVSVTPPGVYAEGTSVGPAPDGIEVQTVTDGTSTGTDEIGELWVRGRNIMRGYYKAPDLTAEVITPDGWFRTGDLARIDARGWITIAGRLKELIIRSGFNVYPPEVEGVLTKHPAIALAAVVGRKTDDGNEEVIAFLQPKPGADVDLETLNALAREGLAPYKRPGEYHVMAALPAAATGKILKHKLLGTLEATGDSNA